MILLLIIKITIMWQKWKILVATCWQLFLPNNFVLSLSPGDIHKLNINTQSDVDKPARLIIRLLFGFVSDSETSAMTLWERVQKK